MSDSDAEGQTSDISGVERQDLYAGLLSALQKDSPKLSRKKLKRKKQRASQAAADSAAASKRSKSLTASANGRETAAQQQEAAEPDPLGDHAAAGAAAFEPPDDTFAEHWDREAAPEAVAGQFRPAFEAAGGSTGSITGSRKQKDSGPRWWAQGAPLKVAPLPLAAYGVKERLRQRWIAAGASGGTHTDTGGDTFADAAQAQLFGLLNSYRDVTLADRPYPARADAPDPVMDAILLHALNHCNRTADRIKKDNEALKAAAKGGVDIPRDQGFTRAKVLVLAPFRNTAAKILQRLWQLAQAETRTDSVQNRDRFMEEFVSDEGPELEGKRQKQQRPPEHTALFAGNCDDHFRLGIKLTRGSVRLYSEFFQSDIIVASPLALATFLSETASAGDAGAADFLSSIEIAVVERADVLLMQNWSHVKTVFDALNELPKAQRDTNVMRVRPYYLDGQARSFRQTVLLSSFQFPELNALASHSCRNFAGRALLRVQHQGVLASVLPQLRQVFERVAAPGATAADARFEHFRRAVWPRIQSSGQLLFVASYFDYVRLRNFLQSEAFEFAHASEYASHSEAARARSHFADGRAPLLLFTERSHFYNRPRIPGIKDILFYQLPQHAQYYAELVNNIGGGEASAHATVTALFAPEDAGPLERVVGGVRSRKMLKDTDTPSFLFC